MNTTTEHTPTCAAYHERANAVREALVHIGCGGVSIPPAFTDAGLARAIELVAASSHPDARYWHGALVEYQTADGNLPDGDQFAEACDCGAI